MVSREMPVSEHPGLVEASPDMDLRRGGGMEESRPVITYQEFLARKRSGQSIRHYSLIYLAPTDAGPGSGERIAMPAEKDHKWYAQGYRPENYEPPPPPLHPQRWLPSMIEEAINVGEPIPKELAPPAYIGPVFETPDNIVEAPGEVTPAAAEPAGTETVFRCGLEDCARFFDSEKLARSHRTKEHKGTDEPETTGEARDVS